MNEFKLSGKVLDDVRVINDNVARIRLMVSSNTGPDKKLRNDFFDLVAFGEVSTKLKNNILINDNIDVKGHLANSRYNDTNGNVVHKNDLIIDKFNKGINS